MKTLKLESVGRVFPGRIHALESIDFEVEGGEAVGLIGRNGAGKSTLLQIAMGVLAPTTGSVSVFGQTYRKAPMAIKSRIGFVSESSLFPPSFRVRDVFGMHARLFPKWDVQRERTLCMRLDIDPSRKLGTLSKGQLQRVAWVGALAHHPDLLLMDEPAAGLDPAARREAVGVALEAQAEDGSAVVFSSHHLGDVERLATRVAFLEGGQLAFDRGIDELREATTLVLATDIDTERYAAVRAMNAFKAGNCKGGKLRAVFDEGESELRSLFETVLPQVEPQYLSVPLEELFVELAGMDS